MDCKSEFRALPVSSNLQSKQTGPATVEVPRTPESTGIVKLGATSLAWVRGDGETMKRLPSILVTIAALLGMTTAQKLPPLQLVRTTDLPGITGDMDHLAVDLAGNRLFVAAEDNGTLRVLNLSNGKLERTVKGFETPHSILYLAKQHQLYITDGSKDVKVLNSDTFKVEKLIPTTPGADSMAADKKHDVMWVVAGGKDVNMTRSVLTEINTKEGKVVKQIPVDAAHVEALALQPQGPKLYVNVTDKNYLAVINRSTGKTLDEWRIQQAKQNAPLAFDPANHRLFIVCRDPGMLVVLDSRTGNTIASFPAGGVADGVVFDSIHHRIYVPAGAGAIYPYEEIDANHFRAMKPIPSAIGAKTAVLSPNADYLYVSMSPGEKRVGAKVFTFKVN